MNLNTWEQFKIFFRNYFHYIIVITILVILYSKIIYLDPLIVNRDDFKIISPLWNIHSITDYYNEIFYLRRADFQPLTDASFFLDIIIKKIFSFSTYHLSNTLYWFISILLFYKLLNFISDNRFINSLFIILFSTYPTFSMVIPWVSSRKHILGFIFFLLTQLNFLKLCKEWKRGTFYFLQVSHLCILLSHPLFAIWPIWSLFYIFFLKDLSLNKTIKILWFPFLSMGLWLIFNYFRFMNFYQQHQLNSLRDSFSISNLPDLFHFLLGYGRYLLNLILPINLAISYDVTDDYNSVGIFLSIIAFIFLYRHLKLEQFLIWIVYLLLPLFFVLWKIQITLVDTYLLWPSAALFIMISLAIKNINSYITSSIFTILIFVSVFISYYNIQSWLSAEDLYKRSYENVPNCIISGEYASILLENKKFDVAIPVIEEHMIKKCNTTFTLRLIDMFYLTNSKINPDSKNKYFKHRVDRDFYANFYLAALKLSNKEINEAFKLFLKNLNDPRSNIFITRTLYPTKLFIDYCNKNLSNTPECEKIRTTLLK